VIFSLSPLTREGGGGEGGGEGGGAKMLSVNQGDQAARARQGVA
jgi:hypothetical protein